MKNRKFEINQENLVDIFSGAFFSCYSEWFSIDWDSEVYKRYQSENDCIEDVLAKMIMNGEHIIVTDKDEYTEYELNKTNLEKGLNVLRDQYPKMYAVWMTWDDDYYINDGIIQCSLYNEIIYV